MYTGIYIYIYIGIPVAGVARRAGVGPVRRAGGALGGCAPVTGAHVRLALPGGRVHVLVLRAGGALPGRGQPEAGVAPGADAAGIYNIN